MPAHLVLVAVALWAAWRPAETHATTPLVVAAAIAALLPWAWRRRGTGAAGWVPAAAVTAALLAASGLTGADPAGAMANGALVVAVAALAFTASRQRPPGWAPAVLALGVAALGAYALWQVGFGLEAAAQGLADLPPALREDAAARLREGRAFASLSLPGHLAVLLATAVPLLVGVWRRPGWRLPAACGLTLAGAGIALTRSPLGAGLALAAGLAALPIWRRSTVAAAASLGLVLVAATVLLRPDLRRLEPVELRLANWRTALWAFSTAPVAGVGFGGYGQASLAVPFETENLPAHAHSLPLEWLAELGLAGGALVLLAVAGLAAVARRCWSERPELAVAVLVVPLHNLADFSLWAAGVALPWGMVLGWAVACGRVADPPPRSAGRWRALAIAAVACGVAAATFHLAAAELGRAAAVVADPREAVETWRRAHRLAPWRVSPLLELGGAALASGSPELTAAALQELERWSWLRPRSAAVAGLSSRLELARGELPAAIADAWTASRRRPVDPDLARAADDLVRAASEHGSDPAR